MVVLAVETNRRAKDMEQEERNADKYKAGVTRRRVQREQKVLSASAEASREAPCSPVCLFLQGNEQRMREMNGEIQDAGCRGAAVERWPWLEPVTLNEGGEKNTLTIGENHVAQMWHLVQRRLGGGRRVGNHLLREKVRNLVRGLNGRDCLQRQLPLGKLSIQVPASQVDAVLWGSSKSIRRLISHNGNGGDCYSSKSLWLPSPRSGQCLTQIRP